MLILEDSQAMDLKKKIRIQRGVFFWGGGIMVRFGYV